jgi:hypothetical protein
LEVYLFYVIKGFTPLRYWYFISWQFLVLICMKFKLVVSFNTSPRQQKQSSNTKVIVFLYDNFVVLGVRRSGFGSSTGYYLSWAWPLSQPWFTSCPG